MGIVWPIAMGILLYLLQTRASKQPKYTHRTLVVITLVITISLICALIASYSRGAWIGSIAAFVVMLFFLPYRPIIGVGSVIVTIALGITFG